MVKEQLTDLVISAQGGDSEAMSRLFNDYYNDLYYFALKTVKDSDLAFDVTQEAFIDIINNLHTLKEPAAFVSWAKRITYHQCTRYFKKKKDVLVDEDEDGNTIFDNLREENAEFIPDEALEKTEFKKTVMAIVDELSEEQRAAVMMFYFDEMSVGQIAEMQGVSEGTVKSRLNYGRKAIKKSVEDYEKKHNVKLHALPFFPFFKWLFEGAFEEGLGSSAMAEAAKGITAATGKAITVSVSSAAAAATATTATATAAAAAATTLGGGAAAVAVPLSAKIVAGVTAAVLLAGGSVGVGMMINSANSEPNTETEVAETVPIETEPVETVPVETEPPHEHTYTVTDTVESTCTTDGSVTYLCDCGDTYTLTEAAEGHSFGEWVTVVAPTYAVNGENSRVCTVCAEVETESIAMPGFSDAMAEEIAGAVFWANFSTHRNIYESDYSTAFTSEQAAIFVVDYLHRLHSSKVEEYAIYEDYGTWIAFLGCDIPVSVLNEYAEIVLGCTYDFASIATGDVVEVRLPVGMGGTSFTYQSFEAEGDDKYVVTMELSTLGADGPYSIGTDAVTVQYHASGIWSILGCVHTPADTGELTDEHIGQVFSSLEAVSDEFLGSGTARIKGIYTSDYSGLSADSVARFVVFYLSSELEEYFTYSTLGEGSSAVTYASECNMPMSLLEEYATIIFGCSYDFSSLANGDNAKIAMPFVGGRGGADVFRKYIGFEDKGNNTLAITVNLMERDWETGNDTVLVSGVLTVIYDEETGIWGVRGYEETPTPDPNACGHKGEKSYVYLDTRYHASRCSICEAVIDDMKETHTDNNNNYLCDYCGQLCCTHEGVHRYTANYDGTHYEVCNTCNHIIGDPQNCADSDGDAKCDNCRYPVPCEQHPEEMCGYYDIGANTHALCCEACYTVIYSTEEAHEDNDADGICDVCSNMGFAVPAIPDAEVPA